jgi:hypothetical protein
MRVICLIAALAVIPAYAQDSWKPEAIDAFPAFKGSFEYPLIVFSDKSYTHEIFKMEKGACLRGPLTIQSPDGLVVFSLTGGGEYPPGCASDSKK